MAKVPYIGVDGVARKCKSLYIGVDGVARKVKSGYIGVDGVARKFFSSGKPLSEFAEGDIVYINEDGSPVEFYVAKHDYESDLNGSGRTLVVRKCITGFNAWNSTGKNSYSGSTISTWLNKEYKNNLDNNIISAIGTTKFYYTRGNGYNTVSTTEKGVFLLSLTELGLTASYANTEGHELGIASSLQIAFKSNGSPGSTQWTRSPDTSGNNSVYFVTTRGTASSTSSLSVSGDGTRPAFTLPADTPVNEDTLVVLG